MTFFSGRERVKNKLLNFGKKGVFLYSKKKAMKKLELSISEVQFYNSLNERSRRLYVGKKAIELGWHGVELVSLSYGVHPNTVRKGKKELLLPLSVEVNSVRKSKGFSKKKR